MNVWRKCMVINIAVLLIGVISFLKCDWSTQTNNLVQEVANDSLYIHPTKVLQVGERGLDINHNEKKRTAANRCCREMFDVGWNCGNGEAGQEMRNFTARLSLFLEVKERNVQSVGDYHRLAESLPKLVSDKGEILIRNNETRLTLSDGKLSYLPCAIREYSKRDMEQCFKFKAEESEPIWVAFYGDSKMRERFQYMASATNSLFNWSFVSGEEDSEVLTIGELAEHMKSYKYLNREALSLCGAKLTYVCSRLGRDLRIIRQWAEVVERQRVPDILIIEFGAWAAVSFRLNNFRAEDDSLFAWKHLLPLLKNLTKRVQVFVSSHTRLRTPPNILYHSRRRSDRHNKLKLYSLEDSTFDFLDMIMREVVKESDVIPWDSTLPMNLASRQDCATLRKFRSSPLWLKDKEKDSSLSMFRCGDDIHRTRATLRDEFTMILNFVCNRYWTNSKNSNYCCSN